MIWICTNLWQKKIHRPFKKLPKFDGGLKYFVLYSHHIILCDRLNRTVWIERRHWKTIVTKMCVYGGYSRADKLSKLDDPRLRHCKWKLIYVGR